MVLRVLAIPKSSLLQAGCPAAILARAEVGHGLWQSFLASINQKSHPPCAGGPGDVGQEVMPRLDLVAPTSPIPRTQ